MANISRRQLYLSLRRCCWVSSGIAGLPAASKRGRKEVEAKLRITVLVLLVVMTTCQSRNPPSSDATLPTANSAPAPTTSDRPTDRWLGQWNGPEGTFLLLSANGGKYVVKIQSLDGPATYEGTPSGDRIEFQRGGKTESIRAGSGEGTGMKWLLDKKNCLIVKTGEGFCRD